MDEVGEGKQTEDTAKEKKDPIAVYTAAAYVLSFIVIGLPLWWNTTNVYRIALPYSEIKEFASLQVPHLIPVTVVLADRNIHEGALWEELSMFSTDELHTTGKDQVKIQYAWKMRTILQDEENILKKSIDVIELDKLLHASNKINDAGVYHIVVLERDSHLLLSNLTAGCHRRGYVVSKTDSFLLGKDVMSVIKTMIQAEFLQKIYNSPSSYERKRPEKDRMRFLSATTSFDVTFSLLVPEPHIVNVHWDIQKAIKAYIQPFIQKIRYTEAVDIKSQILYMTSLPVHSTLSTEIGEHLLDPEQLPSVINPIEAKLGSYASVNPTLNFVIYIPPQEQVPLKIIDKKGDLVPTNSFFSPQWGGFFIKNYDLNSDNSTLPLTYTLDMEEAMEIFLSQLKLLLGLPDMNFKEKLKQVHILEDSEFCEWELDFLLRKSSQEKLSVAISSLYSLGELLQTISNIVIKDDVGEKIYFAVSAIKNSLSALQQGILEEGAAYAEQAFNASEAAFFDPSLLALLYFPDDQKYAIYIPLFLPISIPVIISVKLIWSYWREIKAKKLKKD